MRTIKPFVYLVLGIILVNSINIFLSYLFAKNLIGGWISFPTAILCVFALLFLLYKKPLLTGSEFFVTLYGTIVIIGVLYVITLLMIQRNHFFKLTLKEVPFEQITLSDSEYDYAKIYYDSVLYQHTISNIRYNLDDNKNYEGEFLVPLKTKENLSVLPWIYIVENYGWKRQSDVEKNFKEELKYSDYDYFKISKPNLPWVSFEEAEIKSKGMSYNGAVILEKVDPTHDISRYTFWMYFTVGLVNVLYLAVLVIGYRKMI